MAKHLVGGEWAKGSRGRARRGSAAAALLFGGLDMLQIQFQTAGIEVSNRLVNLFPYAAVIVVLTVWGSTRMPAAVGESYESEE